MLETVDSTRSRFFQALNLMMYLALRIVQHAPRTLYKEEQQQEYQQVCRTMMMMMMNYNRK
jgi:hypothetical protein